MFYLVANTVLVIGNIREKQAGTAIGLKISWRRIMGMFQVGSNFCLLLFPKIRCMLNIWGVILYLRLPWITAQAGIGKGFFSYHGEQGWFKEDFGHLWGPPVQGVMARCGRKLWFSSGHVNGKLLPVPESPCLHPDVFRGQTNSLANWPWTYLGKEMRSNLNNKVPTPIPTFCFSRSDLVNHFDVMCGDHHHWPLHLSHLYQWQGESR